MRAAVLLTCAGRRVRLLQAFAHELKQRLPSGRVLAADAAPTLSAACAMADGVVSLPPLNDPTYIDALVAACQAHDVGIVVPTIDTELAALAAARERFAELGVSVLVSDASCVTMCRDKVQTARFLAAHDVPTPAAIDPRGAVAPPVFVKPRAGSNSVGARVIREVAQMTPALRGDPQLMWTAYLDPAHHDEYTVDCYYSQAGRLCCVVPRQRLKVRAGEVCNAVTRRNALMPFIRRRLGHVEGFRGCITMQFFVHAARGDITAIEINPRFGGGYPLSYAAGANFPGWLLDEYLFAREPTYDEAWEPNLLMLRYDAEVLRHGGVA